MSIDYEIDLDLCVPMRLQHDQRLVMEHLKRKRQAFHAARAGLIERSFRDLTFRQVHLPFVGDSLTCEPSLTVLTTNATSG